jgi:formylglycine-generating enzyme required for sulfatase activity
LNDSLPPIGFWSYTSSDDIASRKRLSGLRSLLADELQLKIGRSAKVTIFQDTVAIPYGADWLRQIQHALAGSSFLIPIITPAFLESEMCCQEVMHFREREVALGRDDLIFPLHYVNVDPIVRERPELCHDPAVLELLSSRQWIDFRSLRTLNPESEPVLQMLDRFLDSLASALKRRIAPPQPLTPVAPPAATRIDTPPPAPSAAPRIVIRERQFQPGDFEKEGTDFPEMVMLPPGHFLRGAADGEDEREGLPIRLRGHAAPQRGVTFSRAFWLGRSAVTRGQFAAFVNDAGYPSPPAAFTFEPDALGNWIWRERPERSWRSPGFDQTDRHPVTCISRADAIAYIDWLNCRTRGGYRLPSEAEWEYAARAGSMSVRYWGDTLTDTHRYANIGDQTLRRRLGKSAANLWVTDGDDGYPFTAPAGSFQPNAFGLFDMLGNVWEWCADAWHETYDGAPDDGSPWTTAQEQAGGIVRGGSWLNDPRVVRAAYRHEEHPARRGSDIGFRLARD